MSWQQKVIIFYLDDVTNIIGAVIGAIIIITIGAYLILFRADEKVRSKVIKNIVYPIAAFTVLALATQITGVIYNLMVSLSDTVSVTGTGVTPETLPLEPLSGSLGFIEKMVYSVADMILDGILFLREMIFGPGMNIQDIIFNADPNPLVSMEVSLSGGGTVNLYKHVMTFSAFIIFLMVVRTAYQLLYASVDDRKGSELRESIYRWIKIPVLVMVAPLFFLALSKAVGFSLALLNDVAFSPSYVDIYGLESKDYGFGIVIAKYYMLFIEFKMWTMMFYRKVVINVLYVITPLAIVLSGHPDEFDSFNIVLSTTVKFLFYPFYYGLAYFMVMLVLQSMAIGSNYVVVIIGLGFIFKVVDIIILVFTIKKQAHMDNTGGLGNSAGLLGASVVAATALSRNARMSSSARTGGTSIASSVVGGATGSTAMSGMKSMARSATSTIAKSISGNIGQSKGMAMAGKIGSMAAKGAMYTAPKAARTAAAVGAGALVTAMTGNVGAGVMAGSGMHSMAKGISGNISQGRANIANRNEGVAEASRQVSNAEKALGIEKAIANKASEPNAKGIHNATINLDNAKRHLNRINPVKPAVASADMKNHSRK